MAVGDTHVFPGFLTPVLTQLFPKPPISHMLLQRWEAKIRCRKSSPQPGIKQPPGHESDMLTTEPPVRGEILWKVA